MATDSTNEPEHQPSVWLGSQHPRVSGELAWLPGHDQSLRELVEGQGRPLLVVARNSEPSGRKGCMAAAEDAFDAVKSLAERTGLDARALLPDRSVLAEWLYASSNVHRFVDRAGRPFRLRTCLVDLTEHGILLCLSAGSASKLDADHQQPHVSLVQKVIREVDPPVAGMFTKRFDRLSRSTSMLVVQELRALDDRLGSSWSGDADMGRWDIRSDMAEIFNTVQGVGARREAQTIRLKALRGMERETGTVMRDGRVPFAAARALPPGLFRFKDRLTRRTVMALDSPEFYPSQDASVSIVPDVRDESGALVDQVANVRWVLENFGLNGRGESDLLDELVARRLSSEALRSGRRHGPSAYWGGPTAPVHERWCHRWFDVFERNLALYESGRMVVRLDAMETKEIVVEGVFPPSGEWARPEDFERIRTFLQARRDRPRPRPTFWSWAGLPVTLNGQPGRLEASSAVVDTVGPAWAISFSSRNARWRFAVEPDSADPVDSDSVDSDSGGADPVGADSGSRVPSVYRRVPDSVLMAAIVEAVVEANGQPLRPLLEAGARTSDASRLRGERDRLAAEIVSREDALDLQLEQIMATDGATFRMPDALRDAAYRVWTSERAKVDEKIDALNSMDRRLAAFRSRDGGISVSAMQDLVNGLRDPAAGTHRDLLRRGVRNLRFSTGEPSFDGSRQSVRLSFEGELVFATSRGPRSVEFSGAHVHGPPVSPRDVTLQTLADLRAGKVARFSSAPGRTNSEVGNVGALLGLDRRQFQVGLCGDSDLLRLGMAAMYPEPAPGEDPALVLRLEDLVSEPALIEQFGDVPALVDAIHAHYSRFRAPRWLSKEAGRAEVEALIASGSGDPGQFEPGEAWKAAAFRQAIRRNKTYAWSSFRFPDRPVVNPCRFCGSPRVASVRVPEVTGYMCLAPSCRRDERGVTWPTRFDLFVSWAPLWQAAGVHLDIPEGTTFKPRELRLPAESRRRSTYGRLNAAERAEMVALYDESTMTVDAIKQKFRVTSGVLYAALTEAGVTLRQHRSPSSETVFKLCPALHRTDGG